MSDHSRRSHCVYLLALGCSALLLGCGSFNSASTSIASVITPYRMDVVQGNVVTREQVAALKIGMPRAQVRDVLGSALLTSVFHANRWDYVFTLKRQGVEPQSRKVTVFFKNDLLERTESDELPSEAEFVATLKSKMPTGAVPPLEATPEALSAFPVAPKPAPAPSPAVTAPSSYPPLEPVGK
ncbi:MAG: outer membrane protein assembly factor BamE [Burkholderiales bacterium]|nr:outer membrane protein assembly factor BamE [Burkholderiales bacterium]